MTFATLAVPSFKICAVLHDGLTLTDFLLAILRLFPHPLASWSPDSVIPGSNIIVNYLPASLTEAQLVALFSPYGTIQHYKIVRDYQTKQSLGYGFVQYTEEASAQNAIKALNGFAIEGKRLKVSIARPSCAEIQHANVFISGLPDNWTRQDLMNLFQPYAPIIEARVLTHPNGQSRNVGFCRLSLGSSAQRAIQELNNTTPPNCSTKLVVKLAGNPNQHNRQRHNNQIQPQRMYAQPSTMAPQTPLNLAGGQPQGSQQNPQLLAGATAYAAPGMYKTSYVDVGYPHQQGGYYAGTPTQQAIHLTPGAPAFAFHPHPGHPHAHTHGHAQPLMITQQGGGYIQPGTTSPTSPPGLFMPHPHGLITQQPGANPAVRGGTNPANANGTVGTRTSNHMSSAPLLAGGVVPVDGDGSMQSTQVPVDGSDPSAVMPGTLPGATTMSHGMVVPAGMDYDQQLHHPLPHHSQQQQQQQQPKQIQPNLRKPQFQGICLFVYHLPPEATENTLFSLFSPHVTVHSAKVMKDLKTGQSRGFGFVNVGSQAEAELAIQKLNGYKIMNKTLRVSLKTDGRS